MKNNFWFKLLYTLIFIVTPAFVGYLFILPDWVTLELPTYSYWLIAFGYILYVILITGLFVYFGFVDISITNINIPLALVLAMIVVTYDVATVWRAIIVLSVVISAWPINIFVNYLSKKIDL